MEENKKKEVIEHWLRKLERVMMDVMIPHDSRYNVDEKELDCVVEKFFIKYYMIFQKELASEEYERVVLKYPMYDILLQHYLQSNSPKKLSQ